ncbi:MAG: HK97 family phage prohead protease [Rickettsiaceae bacterium]
MQKGWISPEFIVKSRKDNNTIIVGYASVFGVTDSQNDVISKGAFKFTEAHKVKLLWQHDVTKPIGVVKALEEDEYGLKIEAEINSKTVAGAEAIELIKQKAVCGLSIGFVIKSSDYSKNGVRVIDNVELMEISVVTFPSNTKAQINQIKQSCSKNEALDELSSLIEQLENY